jgi:hypothetical protein
MKFIDFLIEGTTYISILIFVVQFTRYSWQRATTQSSNAVLFPAQPERPTCTECGEPAEWLDQFCQTHWEGYTAAAWHQVATAAAELMSQPKIEDRIVPFVRRSKPQPRLTDTKLVAFAKRIGFPGSKKWSCNRRLSSTVRTKLLQLAQQTA